jgi:hypothetical protein
MLGHKTSHTLQKLDLYGRYLGEQHSSPYGPKTLPPKKVGVHSCVAGSRFTVKGGSLRQSMASSICPALFSAGLLASAISFRLSTLHAAPWMIAPHSQSQFSLHDGGFARSFRPHLLLGIHQEAFDPTSRPMQSGQRV